MSYCTRCGKQINYDSPICAECVEELRAANVATESAEASEAVSKPETTAAEVVTESVTEEPAPVAETPTREIPRYTYVPEEASAPSGGSPVMRGFGKGLTSAILSFVAYIISIVTTAMAVEDGSWGAIVFLALPATVVSLILGISAIKTFTSSQDRPKPIPALALGISGVAMSGFAALFNFISLMIAITA